MYVKIITCRLAAATASDNATAEESAGADANADDESGTSDLTSGLSEDDKSVLVTLSEWHNLLNKTLLRIHGPPTAKKVLPELSDISSQLDEIATMASEKR